MSSADYQLICGLIKDSVIKIAGFFKQLSLSEADKLIFSHFGSENTEILTVHQIIVTDK